MNIDEIREVARAREDDPAEVAEIREWLRMRDPSELWGLTPATRVAWLLKHIDKNREALRKAVSEANAFGQWQGEQRRR